MNDDFQMKNGCLIPYKYYVEIYLSEFVMKI